MRTTKTTTSARKAAPRSRNSTRDRERAELAALRQLAQELETHIDSLRRQQQQSSSPSLSTSPTGPAREFVAHAWRRLAERQHRARRDAAQLQRQLSDRVQSNADWIERLWGLLLERRRSDAAANARAMVTLQSKWENALVFERLNTDVQAAAQRSEEVFAAHGIHALGSPGTTMDTQETDRWLHVTTGDCTSLIVCTRWVPFDTHVTSASVWSALSTLQSCPKHVEVIAPGKEAAQAWRGVEQAHGLCTLRFRERITLPTSTEPVLLHYYALVYQVPQVDARGPKVFVWHAVCMSADGIVEHSDVMWLAVERAPSSSLVSRVAVVSQSRVTPRTQSDGAMWRAAVMPLVESCVDFVLAILDNKLLDEKIRQTAKPSRVAAREVADQVTV